MLQVVSVFQSLSPPPGPPSLPPSEGGKVRHLLRGASPSPLPAPLLPSGAQSHLPRLRRGQGRGGAGGGGLLQPGLPSQGAVPALWARGDRGEESSLPGGPLQPRWSAEGALQQPDRTVSKDVQTEANVIVSL